MRLDPHTDGLAALARIYMADPVLVCGGCGTRKARRDARRRSVVYRCDACGAARAVLSTSEANPELEALRLREVRSA